MKKTIAIILSFTIMFSCICAFAENTALDAANTLYNYGLFKGVGTNPDGTPDFALEDYATRQEAVVVLLRLLGKEKEALSKGGDMPFNDVSAWAENYIAYAYSSGITNGTSENTFGADDFVSSNMYLTLVLRALGYNDKNGDFNWEEAYILAKETGLYDGEENDKITRGDIAVISANALNCRIKGSGNTLKEHLSLSGVIGGLNTDNTDSGYEASSVSAIAQPAVFYIEVYDKNMQTLASGSGFFVTEDGVAVTNYHVIADTAYAKITTPDGKIYDVTHVLNYDETLDVAVIRVNKADSNGQITNKFPYLQLGDSSAIINGEKVYAIGSPMGLKHTISDGIISNCKQIVDGVEYIQTTAPISHGSSGGALLNSKAQVIGITAAGYETGQNLGFAIPINVIKQFDFTSQGTDYITTMTTFLNIKVSTTNVNVEKGQRITVYVTAEGNAQDWTIYCKSSNTNVATAAWGEYDSSKETFDAPLIITGESRGTTQVAVFSDVDYMGTYINVTVTDNSVEETVSGGETYKNTPFATYTSVTGTPCSYSIDKNSKSVEGYNENAVQFIYPYNSKDVNNYASYLTSNGANFYDTSFGFNGMTYYYLNGDKLIGITIDNFYNRIIISL